MTDGEYDVDGREIVLKSKKYRDVRTGEVVERFDILDIQYMEEVTEDGGDAVTEDGGDVCPACGDVPEKRHYCMHMWHDEFEE